MGATPPYPKRRFLCMASSRRAARGRVRRAGIIGQAAREIDQALRGLEHLIDAGARHMGGHRSGKRWVEDTSCLALGYWDATDPTVERLSHEQKVDAKLRQIISPELAWDLGVSLPEGHPFAPSVAGRQAA